MSRKAFDKFCKEVKKLSGEDISSRTAYSAGGFETDIHVLESEKGGSVAVRTPNGHAHIKGFIFAGLALEHGFKLIGDRYVYGGTDEDKDHEAKRDSDKDAELPAAPE